MPMDDTQEATVVVRDAVTVRHGFPESWISTSDVNLPWKWEGIERKDRDEGWVWEGSCVYVLEVVAEHCDWLF